MKQWHPLFAEILRPCVDKYYEVQTNFPVGDVPREADIVLLRRISSQRPPFRGIWRALTLWNVLEFKGPSVSPRVRDLDLLVELGLGIDRRLNEERTRKGETTLDPAQVSWWYLANHLGKRFLRDCRSRFGQLQATGPGLWRSRLLVRPLWLVSRIDLPVETDSIPLHLVAKEPVATAVEVGKLLLEQPRLWDRFVEWFASLHPAAWEEVKRMPRTKTKDLEINVKPLVDYLGMEEVIRQIGLKRLLQDLLRVAGPQRVLEEMSLEDLLAYLPAEKLAGLKRHSK